ncbi:MAG TPA: GTPase [Pirellulales bacterium]|nr:GTPase [Pirellulales bacterium]
MTNEHHNPDSDRTSTRAIVLTPEGRGAVATVLVSGRDAMAIVGRLFRPASGRPLAAFSMGRIVFGRWGTEPGEELVVVCRGADRVEIHCHGGQAAVAAVLEALADVGCRPMTWQAWNCDEAGGAIQAEALEALAHARTERTAAILLDQYHGALGRAIDEIARLLAAGHNSSLATARERLQALLARAPLGLHLIVPFQVVLAGRPNVGKSSLINSLVGYRRSIVHDGPGTTRDVVTAATAFDGWPVELSDTAGLRAGGDELESAGVRLARQRLAGAALRVLVFDAGQAWSADDDDLLAEWPDALVVHTKSDLPPDTSRSRPPGVYANSMAPGGVDELARAIAARLVPDPPAPGATVPFAERHIAALGRALGHVDSGDRVSAARALEGAK